MGERARSAAIAERARILGHCLPNSLTLNGNVAG